MSDDIPTLLSNIQQNVDEMREALEALKTAHRRAMGTTFRPMMVSLEELLASEHLATRNACAVRAHRLRVAMDQYLADLEGG